MAEVGEVDPDLVRPTRPEHGLDERHGPEPLERAEDRYGPAPAAAGRQRRPPRARAGPADGAVHPLLPGERPPHERDVAPLDGVGAELALEVLRGGMGEREHEDARGLAVQAVDDVDATVAPRPTFDLGPRAADHRVLLGVARRVDEQPGRLVDHQHVVVRVEHTDRRELRRRRPPGQVGRVRHDVPRADQRPRVGDHGAVHQHVPDQNLVLGAGVRAPERALRGPSEALLRVVHRRSLAPAARRVDSVALSGVG